MIVLVAHGTRDPAGPEVTERLAEAVRAHGVPVRVAYADVRDPDVTSVLRAVPGPAVVVPVFLAAGYHVRVDIPAQIAASGHPDVVITAPLGPAPELVRLAAHRLRAAGYRRGDAVVLAAAGSGDRAALSDVDTAARGIGRELGVPVRIAFAATARPPVAEVVAELRGAGKRVAVASWLLAPGLFQRRVAAAGADVLAEPLGADTAVAELVVRRYRLLRAAVRAA